VASFGLIGTVTSDHIVRDEGGEFEDLGGILYQAAVLCGLGEPVRLFSNCGRDLEPLVRETVGDWPTLDPSGLRFVPGPGNQVFLRYSEQLKEREEVLRFVVPALEPEDILSRLGGLDALLVVFNSGYELSLSGWREVIGRADRPIWLDVHSLVLEKRLGGHRNYAALPDWADWISGVTYVQANRQELACLLGFPERWPVEAEIRAFAAEAFRMGVQGVFVTMGKDGVLVSTPGETTVVRAPQAEAVVDTTGCGDVFSAKAFLEIRRGAGVRDAAAAGVVLASRAVSRAGIWATFELARESARRPVP